LSTWRKLGLVHVADGRAPWRTSHAFVPTPFRVDERTIRVLVAFLDSDKIGRIGYVDLDAGCPTRVLAVSENPILDIGSPGAFDDSGVTPVQVLAVGSDLFLYYNGWQRGVRVPYAILGGLAISRDGGRSFQRASSVPVLERTSNAMLVRSTPFVMPPSDRHARWRMWYSAGSDDTRRSSGLWAPVYGISYAESDDGIRWPLSDIEVMPPALPEEFGLTRPFIMQRGDTMEMLLSARAHARPYIIESAVSLDEGKTWSRKGPVPGLEMSPTGWDSEMTAFGACIRTDRETYLFYNGNGHGASGFGVAVLAD
jgi:hypothetical protein